MAQLQVCCNRLRNSLCTLAEVLCSHHELELKDIRLYSLNLKQWSWCQEFIERILYSPKPVCCSCRLFQSLWVTALQSPYPNHRYLSVSDLLLNYTMTSCIWTLVISHVCPHLYAVICYMQCLGVAWNRERESAALLKPPEYKLPENRN